MPLTAARPEVAVVLLIAGSSRGPNRSDPCATECRLRWRPARRVGYGGTDPIPDGRNPALAGGSVGDQPGRVLTPDETGSLGLAHLATRQHDPGIVLHSVATSVMDGVHPPPGDPPMPPLSPPRTSIWQAHHLGRGDLRVPRREAQPLGFDQDRREPCPDALAILPGEDPGSGRSAGALAYAHGIGLSGRTHHRRRSAPELTSQGATARRTRGHHRRVGEDGIPLGPRESGPTGWSVQRRSTERYRT
jgi:hypothetical protein